MKFVCYGVRGSRPISYNSIDLSKSIATFLQLMGGERIGKLLETSGISKPSKEIQKQQKAYDHLRKLVQAEITAQDLNFINLGGNTPCVEVRKEGHSQHQVIFDMGTGITEFDILPDTKILHIFFTHFHYDHVQGMMFCKEMYARDMTVHFYSPVQGFEQYLQSVMMYPYFPITMKDSMTSHIHFHELGRKSHVQIGDLRITWMLINHPGGSHAYKVSDTKRTFCYFSDVNITKELFKKTKENISFLSDIDVMLLDASMSFEDSITKRNWGHSSFYTGINFAHYWDIKRVYLMHLDPADDLSTLPILHQCALWYTQALQSSVSVQLTEESRFVSV